MDREDFDKRTFTVEHTGTFSEDIVDEHSESIKHLLNGMDNINFVDEDGIPDNAFEDPTWFMEVDMSSKDLKIMFDEANKRNMTVKQLLKEIIHRECEELSSKVTTPILFFP